MKYVNKFAQFSLQWTSFQFSIIRGDSYVSKSSSEKVADSVVTSAFRNGRVELITL